MALTAKQKLRQQEVAEIKARQLSSISIPTGTQERALAPSVNASGNAIIPSVYRGISTVPLPGQPFMPPQAVIGGMSDDLVKEILLNHPDDLVSLQEKSWWKSQPLDVKQMAYGKIQTILSDQFALRGFVVTNNIQNPEQYSWFQNSPVKNETLVALKQYNPTLLKKSVSTDRKLSSTRIPSSNVPTSPFQAAITGISRAIPTSNVISQTSPPITPISSDGLLFQTGNSELDAFLNNEILPLFENEFKKDPLSVLDPKIFQNISQRIEATYGPLFQKAINFAEQEFGRAQEQLTFQKERAETGFSTGELRTREDLGRGQRRLEEDKTRALAENARNFDEMKFETANLYRQRGLTFSGIRGEGERKLGEANERNIGDIERGALRSREEMDILGQRALEDIGRERGYLGRDVGFRERGLEGQLTRERERIAENRLLKEQAELRNLEDLSTALLASPFQ